MRVFQSPTNLRTVASPFLSGPVAPQSTHIAKYRSPLTMRFEPQNGHGFASNKVAEGNADSRCGLFASSSGFIKYQFPRALAPEFGEILRSSLSTSESESVAACHTIPSEKCQSCKKGDTTIPKVSTKAPFDSHAAPVAMPPAHSLAAFMATFHRSCQRAHTRRRRTKRRRKQRGIVALEVMPFPPAVPGLDRSTKYPAASPVPPRS